MSELSLKGLLEAGAHFGHQTHKWNPKMKKYVYGERNGIYIIDLAKTIPMAKKAFDFIKKTASEGRPVLFVGTKRQAAVIIQDAASKCGAFHVTNRWLGGMLTNFKTIALSIDKIRKVEKMKETGDFELLTKKERSKIDKDIIKLERNLGGIKDMRKVPGAVFVVDPTKEHIAVLEARSLGIPVIAIADTNCDPTGIDYIVPGNDDAVKSVAMFTEYFAQSVLEGNAQASKNAKLTKPEKDMALEKEIITKFEKDIDLIGEDDFDTTETEEESSEEETETLK
ncbi:MAG: 30S ribosomal protein S2 [Bdellovibrionales bacterium GWA2_49_15]|nr:MAG: 30S ribosomal protein S2 [Bdellovibrionales bacterium GWA2_49_15]